MNKPLRAGAIVLALSWAMWLLSGAAPRAAEPAVPHPGAAASAIRFAVIGDFGSAGAGEQDVANLVKSWLPDFIITVGDNNYPTGSATTIDPNVGQYYHDFIYPYTGGYGAGSTANRFFPSLGNHDWGNAYPNPSGATPYLAYFTLPGNERYYDFARGPVHFFAVDSDANEPDGTTSSSVQAQWLQGRLAASAETWKLVYFHHPPYSSGSHGSTLGMRWPFKDWGASAVLSGHDHDYERLAVNGLPYFIDGLGGVSRYTFNTPLPESQVRYNADYGAMLVTADTAMIQFQFINRSGVLIDTLTISAPDTTPPTPDPMTWAVAPAATGQTSIAMTATAASDPAGVQYYFTSLSPGGHDSGWLASQTYTDTGLQPGTTYNYRVKARDLSPNLNETNWSVSASATTAAGNRPPIAVDDSVTTNERTAVTFNVLANDSDPDGDPLTVSSFTQPSHGALTYAGNGSFTYSPVVGYRGSDSFSYVASDGRGGTDPALVQITVKKKGGR